MKFVALAEKKEGRDRIGLYYAGSQWKMINSFDVDTLDLVDIKFVMQDTAVLTWDVATESRILMYSIATGDLITRYEPNFINYGIKALTFAPKQDLMAAGMYDGSIVLYNNLTATEIASLQHVPKIDLN